MIVSNDLDINQANAEVSVTTGIQDVTATAQVSQLEKSDLPDLGKEGISNSRNKKVLKALALQLILVVGMYLATYYNSLVHGTAWPVATISEIANYNFIGVTLEKLKPSAAAIIVEVLVWSFLGVAARQIYFVSQLISKDKSSDIGFLETLVKIVGESVLGVAISVAVIAFFLSTRLTIAQVELTLENANILTIIALSFVLGFYHEDTRRLLGSFNRRLSVRNNETESNQID